MGGFKWTAAGLTTFDLKIVPEAVRAEPSAGPQLFASAGCSSRYHPTSPGTGLPQSADAATEMWPAQ